MRVLQTSLESLARITLFLGYGGENEHTEIRIDASAVLGDYPLAVGSLALKDSAGTTYPVALSRESNELIWIVTQGQLAVAGAIEFQLTFINGEEIIKTVIGHARVEESIQADGEMPTPVNDWIESANVKLAEVDSAVESIPQTIENALTEAKESGMFDGPPGPQGAKGDKGDTGATGAQGPKGDTGPAGPQGEKGTKGDTGSQGPKGDKGDTGPAGAQGEKGDAGAKGDKGDKGDTGATGPQGPQGEQGETGPQGEPGDDYVLTAQDKIDIAAIVGADMVVSVSGATPPPITAQAGYRYECGEVSTLSFTPSASGCCDVVFTSGSTPTALTVPETVQWPDWFNPNALEANATYELNVLNGTLGAVGIWT